MTKRKALIIDDEKDTCFLLSVILTQYNYEPGAVHSLAEASMVLPKEKPDVVFLDNNLGDGIGVDYIPELLQKHPAAKVILITAFDTSLTRTKAFKNGAHYFVGKPFDRQDILNALTAVFEPE